MNPYSRRLLLWLVAIITVSTLAANSAGQQTPLQSINYRLSMSRPNSHLFEVAIEVVLPDDLKGKPIDFQMPKWAPGRYAVFDFAKNVQEFRAVGGICPPDRKSTRLNSSHLGISYAVFC